MWRQIVFAALSEGTTKTMSIPGFKMVGEGVSEAREAVLHGYRIFEVVRNFAEPRNARFCIFDPGRQIVITDFQTPSTTSI